MRFSVDEVKINIDELIHTNPREAVIRKLGLNENKVVNFKLTRSSLDCRFHASRGIYRVFSADFDYDGRIRKGSLSPYKAKEQTAQPEKIISDDKVVIIGAGPAGLFAALRLIEYGILPVVVEMGQDLAQRDTDIKSLNTNGVLTLQSNIQFGLGGAGTYSDGKLTSRIKSPYASGVLERFVRFGAKREIMYLSKPHLGTDCLRKIVGAMKEHIINCGAMICFGSKCTDIILHKGAVKGIIVNGTTEIPADHVILAPGNAAGETFRMLINKSIALAPKAFAVGYRVEHPQKLIDSYTYGKYISHPVLEPADYKLTYHDSVSGRGVYSFCCCPGGYVINASSSDSELCVNGMSYSRRNAKNINSAIVASIQIGDLSDSTPIAALEFQKQIQLKAYELGGGGYKAPVMDISDFSGVGSSGHLTPSILPGFSYADLNKCLPEGVGEAIKRGIAAFSEKIPGFLEGIMTGCETRTSSPVRILRNAESLESISAEGLYPAGEGAGYAGGILSSAADGMKIADVIASKLSKN